MKNMLWTRVVQTSVCVLLLSACNTGSFQGGTKKPAPIPQETPKPSETPPAKPPTTLGNSANGEDLGGIDPDFFDPINQTDTDDPEIDTTFVPPVIVVPTPTPTPPPPPVETPTPTPTPTPEVVPPTQPEPPQTPPPVSPPTSEEVGALYFRAVPFVNMEHEIHATDPGTWAILRDSSNKVIGAGPMTLDAACRGQMNDNFGYPDVTLNVALTYVAPEVETGSASGGQGSLSICLVENPSAHPSEMTCRQNVQGANDPSRPAHWHNRSFSYTIESGNQIKIQNKAGFAAYGLQEQAQNGLTYAHPTAAGVCGSSTPQYADYNSPLVLDLNRNGKIDLLSAWDEAKAVKFDLKADGKAVRTGWVTAEDGLLVLDLNKNGLIDDGRELFGEHTPIAFAGIEKATWSSFENGFQALSQYDRNKDGVINDKDEVFKDLRLWTDRNSNGVTDAGELVTLQAQDVKEISLAFYKTGKPYQYLFVKGNEIRLLSTYRDGKGKDHKVGDVWFGVRKTETARKD